MRIAYTAEQERLRRELRGYFGELMTPSVRAALAGGDGDYGDGEAYRSVVRQLGRDGWLALGWPAEYGGRGGTMLDQLIFTDEAAVARVPVPFLTINTVGPTIMRFGSASQKEFYLPKIAAGEIHFSIGYSEPEAGTDLASLRTTAVRDGDEYVIDGQKMWTSLIQHADYVWLACRTDPSADRHRGLSIIIVPVTAAGFSWTPVPTVAGVTTSATYYSSVRVPVSSLVGEENRGWALITNQLNHERVALTSAAPVLSALAEVREWAASVRQADGRRVIDAEWVQLNLARVHAKAEFLKLMNWRVASSAGSLAPADASVTKVFGTEFAVEAYRLLMEVLGASGVVRSGSAGEVLAGRIERAHRAALILTFGGGTNEVQRDIIAAAALGLPLSRRLFRRALVDFTVSEEQAELGGLARKILAEREAPWGDLAAAGVLAAGLPVSLDGAGLGLLEQCSVLVEIGRSGSDVPYLASAVLGAGAVAWFGTASQRSRWARPAGRGSVVLTAALEEDVAGGPCSGAVRSPDGSWVVSGVKTAVPAAPQADLFLVPCASAEGVLVFLVSPSDAGVTVEPQALTSFASAGRLVLDAVVLADDRVLGAGSDVAGWLVARATVGLCAMQVGVLERALELTAEHARTRVQFGRPIGAFQAVAQRLADAYIDVEAVRLTMWQAAWLLASGGSGPELDAAVATAKFWAADAGHRVAHTAVHVHGGLGIDVSYPVHRYFVAAKGNEFALGGATAQLRRIGAVLAGP